jgi:hypothetical protein
MLLKLLYYYNIYIYIYIIYIIIICANHVRVRARGRRAPLNMPRDIFGGAIYKIHSLRIVCLGACLVPLRVVRRIGRNRESLQLICRRM